MFYLELQLTDFLGFIIVILQLCLKEQSMSLWATDRDLRYVLQHHPSLTSVTMKLFPLI